MEDGPVANTNLCLKGKALARAWVLEHRDTTEAAFGSKESGLEGERDRHTLHMIHTATHTSC